MEIRRAHEGDCGEISRLLKIIAAQHGAGRPDLFDDSCAKYDAVGVASLLADNAIFVAEGESGIMGYLIAKIKDQPNYAVRKAYRCLYIDDICVDPNCRKQGAGQALFEAARAYACENGCYNIELSVWEFNDSARGFYERMGMSTQKRTMELILLKHIE